MSDHPAQSTPASAAEKSMDAGIADETAAYDKVIAEADHGEVPDEG